MSNLMFPFIGIKAIKAFPMTREDYNVYRGWTLPEDENGADEGYLVEYEEAGNIKPNHPEHSGYVSWSPKEVFEDAYKPNGQLSFSEALYALNKGFRIRRSGWNGKDMWLSLSCNGSRDVLTENFWSFHNREYAQSQGGSATVLPSITMKTATGEILMGWLASQTDMLADDWEVLV